MIIVKSIFIHLDSFADVWMLIILQRVECLTLKLNIIADTWIRSFHPSPPSFTDEWSKTQPNHPLAKKFSSAKSVAIENYSAKYSL